MQVSLPWTGQKPHARMAVSTMRQYFYFESTATDEYRRGNVVCCNYIEIDINSSPWARCICLLGDEYIVFPK